MFQVPNSKNVHFPLQTTTRYNTLIAPIWIYGLSLYGTCQTHKPQQHLIFNIPKSYIPQTMLPFIYQTSPRFLKFHSYNFEALHFWYCITSSNEQAFVNHCSTILLLFRGVDSSYSYFLLVNLFFSRQGISEII